MIQVESHKIRIPCFSPSKDYKIEFEFELESHNIQAV